ncbi:MAG: PVC-type heme-binding CxxCH protein [Pirellulaceae bacterium]
MPRIAPRDPEGSLKGMHLIPGFRVEIVAAEPKVVDPVDLVFDENGRLYVSQLTTYSESREEKTGRVSVLVDEDGDGRFDKSTVFADGLEWPTGLQCFDGGLFVVSSPNLFYFKDTTGDGKADYKELVISGFDGVNPNQCPNSLRWNLDNRVEMMPSGGGGLLEPVRWKQSAAGGEAKAAQVRGRDLSFEPRTGEIRFESGGSQYGMTFDEWGRKFESSNSAPVEMVLYEDRYIARNPFLAPPPSRKRIWVDGSTIYRTSPLEPWRVVRTEMRIRGVFSGPVEGGGTSAGYFTASCGVMVYKGHAWPKEFRGNAFVCEGAGNLVHRMRLEPNGVEFAAHRTEKESEFWTSDEIWFRPITSTHGPDGLLYLADMYREVYEHPDAVPPSVRKYIDLNTGNDRGRIYRILPEGFKQPKPVRLGDAPTEQLVPLLAHPNVWHRRTASRLLYERQDDTAIEPLTQLASQSSSPLGRMHAMYALSGLDALTSEIVQARLGDEHPRVREHAIRLAEQVLDESPALRAGLYALVGDDDIRVRYQLAFTLGNIPGTQATDALVAISRRDVGDPWIRLAVKSSCYGRVGEIFSQLAADASWRSGEAARHFLEELAEQAGRQKQKDQVVEVINCLNGLEEDERALAQAVVRGLSKGLAKSKSPLLALLNDSDDSRASQLLAEMILDAKKTAVDETRSEADRTQATRSLAMASFGEARNVLVELMESRQAPEVQAAAVRTLSRFEKDEVAELIVDAWMGYSPKVRGEAAEALFARQGRLSALLAAVEEGTIARTQLAPARIQFLLKHPNEQIRARAERLLGSAQLARRDDVVTAYTGVLKLNGDLSRGRVVFKRECASCHKLEGQGHDLGLPLQNVKSRGPEGILSQVLDPNREVNPTYLNYSVLTVEGRLMTGMITSETATSITLTRGEGEADTILRSDIDELRSSELSVMPEGLEEKVTKQEMADLIAYLMVVAD